MPGMAPDIAPLLPEDPASLGPYTLIGRLGRGGYGVVYLAENSAGERVAIKLLQTQLAEAGGERERFAREAAAAKQVARFCTAQVLDADIAGDQPYIVSEYVAGPSLQALVTARGPLDGGALDRLAIGIATALVAIHQAGIVHRDLKPPNVLIGPDGPRVIDFGIARMMDRTATVTGHTLGTPAYMAPEQVAAREVTPAADVFAWGASIVFAANGSPPFGRDSIAALAHRILHEPPELGALTGNLRALVAECLDKDPARRPVASALLMRLLGHDAHPRTQRAPAAILAEGVTAAVPAVTPHATLPAGGAATVPGAGGSADPALAAPTAAAGTPVRGAAGLTSGATRATGKWWYGLAGLAGAAVLAGGLIAGLTAFNGSGDTPPPKSAHSTTFTTTSGPAETPHGKTTAPTSPAQRRPVARPTFHVQPSMCHLGPSETTCTVSLRGQGAAFDWTGSAADPLRLSSSNGHLEPGETDSVTITLYTGSPREAGSATVTFTGAGGGHTVSVWWEGEQTSPTPDPSTS